MLKLLFKVKVAMPLTCKPQISVHRDQGASHKPLPHGQVWPLPSAHQLLQKPEVAFQFQLSGSVCTVCLTDNRADMQLQGLQSLPDVNLKMGSLAAGPLSVRANGSGL